MEIYGNYPFLCLNNVQTDRHTSTIHIVTLHKMYINKKVEQE